MNTILKGKKYIEDLLNGPVAQLVEHLTFNQVVARSNRAGLNFFIRYIFFVDKTAPFHYT